MLNERVTNNVKRLMAEHRGPDGEVEPLTPAALGRLLGTSRQQATRYLNQELTWDTRWIERVAKALDVDVLQIIGEEFTLNEPASVELARKMMRVVLLGQPPSPVQIDLAATTLRKLIGILVRHPKARTDPAVAAAATESLYTQSA